MVVTVLVGFWQTKCGIMYIERENNVFSDTIF